MDVASLVTISRLKGYSYATAEDENLIFADFFASERSLHVGGLFYTTYEPYKCSYLNHQVKLIAIYPYVVVSIKGSVKPDVNLINLDCAVTSKSCTKVLLDGSSIADNFNPSFHITRCIKEIWPLLSSSLTLSYCFVLHSAIASRPCFLDANLDNDGLLVQLKAYFNSCSYGIDNRFESELYGLFLPLLLSRQQRTASTITCETILIDVKDNSPSPFDVSGKLELLSNQLGLSFVELESRLLLVDSNRLKGLALHSDNRSLHLHSRPIDHSVDAILHTHQGASMILLTDFDNVMGSAHQQGPASAGHATSLEELLADAIQTLHEDIDSKQRQYNQPVFIVALTGCRPRWKASTLRLFSSQLTLSTSITTAPPQAIITQHKLSSGAQSELEKIQKEFQLSSREQEILVDTAASLALQREEQQQWIEHMAMDQYLPMDSRDYSDQKMRGSALSSSSAAAAATENDDKSADDPTLIIRKKDLKRAIKQSQHVRIPPSTSTSSSSRKVASVRWEDIGGLDRVRREILDVLELPMQHPELFAPGAPMRQGVLLYGPPGTGKTLVAKAVATECNMSFLSIKGPELLDSYVGESEKNVRDIFDRARLQAPCVLFFDEVDSLAPTRAKRNDSGGGVMDRIVSQLLTEMDQLFSRDHHDQDNPHKGMVFIIAATNRPDLLDPALLRPGRFDRRIYLGVSSDVTARINVLKAQTRKFILAADIDLLAVAETMPTEVTGADIGAVTTAAYNLALQRKLVQLREAFLKSSSRQNGKSAGVSTEGSNGIDKSQEEMWALTEYMDQLPKSDLQVIVQQIDFLAACNDLKPSVFDLAHYEELQAQFES